MLATACAKRWAWVGTPTLLGLSEGAHPPPWLFWAFMTTMPENDEALIEQRLRAWSNGHPEAIHAVWAELERFWLLAGNEKTVSARLRCDGMIGSGLKAEAVARDALFRVFEKLDYDITGGRLLTEEIPADPPAPRGVKGKERPRRGLITKIAIKDRHSFEWRGKEHWEHLVLKLWQWRIKDEARRERQAERGGQGSETGGRITRVPPDKSVENLIAAPASPENARVMAEEKHGEALTDLRRHAEVAKARRQPKAARFFELTALYVETCAAAGRDTSRPPASGKAWRNFLQREMPTSGQNLDKMISRHRPELKCIPIVCQWLNARRAPQKGTRK